MRDHLTKDKWLLGAALAFAAAASAIWACAPVMKEDAAFREMLRYFNGGSDSFCLKGLWDYILCQREVDNGRLANIISPLATLYGNGLLRGIIGGFSLSSTYLFIVLTARGGKAGSRGADLLFFGAAALGGFFLLPFRDNMVVFDYALNYILSSALCFAFCLGVCRAAVRPRGGWETALACLAGFLAGANHDGFALPLLGAAGCYAISRRFRLPPALWAMGLSLLCGALVPVSAPSEWDRAAGAIGGVSLAESLRRMALLAPAVFLPLLVPIAAVGSRSLTLAPPDEGGWRVGYTRHAASLREGEGPGGRWAGKALLWGIWVFSLGLFLPFGLDARQGWLPGCAAMGLVMAYARPVAERLPRRLNLACGAALTAAACALALYIARWQRVVAENDAMVLRALRSSPDGTAYADRLHALDLPKLSLARLANDRGNLSVSYGPLNLNAPDGKVYVVVPSAIKGYRDGTGRRIPGGCRMVEFEGHLLLDSVPEVFSRSYTAGRYSEAWLTIDYIFASGREARERHRAFRFALPDGTPMVYVITDGLLSAAKAEGGIAEARLAETDPFPHQIKGKARQKATAR